MDGIEDNGHTFQFNVEQREAKTNVTGKVSASSIIDKNLIIELGQQNS